MTTIYIAFDGKQFQNEGDCAFYEWSCAHTLLDRIEFYDSDGIRIFNYFSESAYNSIVKIIVKDQPSLQQLKDLADYTGFCSYEDITSIGTWIWDKNQEKFVKQEEKNNDINVDENKENKNS